MPDAPPTAAEWIATYAALLGLSPPTPEEVETLLNLAAVAAHASERIAAPLACWLVGQSGLSPAAAHEAAHQVTPKD